MTMVTLLIATNSLTPATTVQTVCREEHVPHDASHVVSLSAALPALQAHEQCSAILVCLTEHIAEGLATIRELRGVFSKRIVAVGNSADSKLVIEAIRCGANDFLDEGPALAGELKDLLARIKQAEAASRENSRVLTVTSSGGGTGTSFIATNLAAIFAQEQGTCCLLDLVPHGGDQTALLSLKPRYTLPELLRKFSSLDLAMFEQSLTEHSSGIKLLANPRTSDHFRELPWPMLQDLLRLAKHVCPMVVVDFPETHDSSYARAIASSDLVLVTLRLDFVSVIRTRQLIEQLLHAGTDKEKLRLVANRGGQALELPLSKVEKAIGTRICRVIPDDPATVNPSINLGKPVIHSAPDSRIATQLWHLASDITDCQLTRPTSNHALAGLTTAAALSFMKLFPN